MAVLPGIDANDESKTAAVFQFYTAGEAQGPRSVAWLLICTTRSADHSQGVVTPEYVWRSGTLADMGP